MSGRYRLSRMVSLGTVGYGIFALARPRHLGRFMSTSPSVQQEYDVVARAYGARDLAIGALAVLGRTPPVVRTAMALRIAMDLSDAAILSPRTPDDATRNKLLGLTVGWASVNALALVVDHRRARR